MATKTEGNLLPGNTDVPLDSRARVQTLDDIESIDNPYIGLLFYVIDTGKVYVVTSLKSKENIIGVTIPNALVDTYAEVSGQDGKDGVDGAPGKDGVDGKDGAPGEPGKDGADGAPGRDGVDGAPGEPGKDGADGKDGVTPSITIGTVSVVDDPAQANVSLGEDSTDTDVILNFAIPRGPAGSGSADAEVLANISAKVDAIDEALAGVTEILDEIVNGGCDEDVVKTSEDDILKALLIFSK